MNSVKEEETQKLDWEYDGGGGEDDVNVFVKYLPAEVGDGDLRALFASCGEIVSAKVMKDGSSGSSMGYGFVRFASPEGARKAVTRMNGIRVANKVLLCKLSTRAIYPQLSTNLYIKPLPIDFTEDQLEKTFSSFGPIRTSKILVDKRTGESMQIGFVKFEHQESATDALEKMNGSKLKSNLPCLIVKYAESDIQRVTRQARTQPPRKQKLSPPSPAEFPPAFPYYVPAEQQVPVCLSAAYCYPYVPCVPYHPAMEWYFLPHNPLIFGYPEFEQ